MSTVGTASRLLTLFTRRLLLRPTRVLSRRHLRPNRPSPPLAFKGRRPFMMTTTMAAPCQSSRSAFSIKPPNILVFGDNDRDWKAQIERVINTDLYLVYTTTAEELQSSVWVDNCRLLWLVESHPEHWPDGLKANLVQYIEAGGTVVVKDASLLNTDILAGKAIVIDDDAELRASFEKLGVSCEHDTDAKVQKTEGYLISDKRVDSFFKGRQPEEEFRISEDAPVTDAFTPVRLSRPDRRKFNTDEYFQFLRTRQLGRTLFYTENVATTMMSARTVDSVHGAVAVATRQIRAVARGRNSWISPPGCAMYTIVLHFSQADRIAGRLSFLQHMAALSAVRAIRSVYPSLEVAIKWPNDVYFRRDTKIGGILCTCTVSPSAGFRCYVGCGMNIANHRPLTCVNELAGSNELTVERFIATKLTEFERLLDLYERDPSKVLEEYHDNWLHTGEKVTVEAANARATVLSVDEDGFLIAEKANRERLRLQPDGNSFDLMKGLITVKKRAD